MQKCKDSVLKNISIFITCDFKFSSWVFRTYKNHFFLHTLPECSQNSKILNRFDHLSAFLLSQTSASRTQPSKACKHVEIHRPHKNTLFLSFHFCNFHTKRQISCSSSFPYSFHSTDKCAVPNPSRMSESDKYV